ncbi:MAG: DNRLRE domain-containing protein [Caldilineaceae bacterium]
MCALLLGGDFALAQSEDSEEKTRTPISATEPTVLQRTVAAGAIDTVVSLPANEDTYVASNRSSTNYGGADSLLLGYSAEGANAGALRILLRFDFHGNVPTRAVIHSAKVRLRMYSSTGGGMSTVLRHLNSGWNEFDVTWSSHEPDWGGIDTGAGIGTSPGWVEWDVTTLAKQWMNGSRPNDGVIIQGDETPSEHQRAFWSRNAGGGEHPQLIVDYSEAIQDTRTPDSNLTHPKNQYQLAATFNVEWDGHDHADGSGIDYYDVQFREPGQDWQNWLLHTRDRRGAFTGQNGHTYEFRVRAVDLAHNVEAYPNDAEARTTVDTAPPVVNVTPLAPFEGSTTFPLSWAGVDGESGVSHYDVQFRYDVQPWQDWLQNLTQTSVQASGANGDPIEFRVRAADRAGNVSAWEAPNAATSTTVDTVGPALCGFVVSPTGTVNQYRLTWTAVDANGSGIRFFNVRYRHNSGAFQNIISDTTATTADVTLTQGDGVYTFELRATDVVGNESTLDTRLIIDSAAPPFDNNTYLPLIGVQIPGCQ